MISPPTATYAITFLPGGSFFVIVKLGCTVPSEMFDKAISSVIAYL